MNPLTVEWVAKAEGDHATVEREARARKDPNYDAVCFHAQQSAEKYLKGLLCEAGVAFPKTHDLVALLDLLLPVQPLWEHTRDDLAFLADFAVGYRYPGDSADKESAMDARKRCRRIRKAARQAPIRA